MTAATKPGFTEADIRAAASRQSFERGLGYLDAVTSLEIIGSQAIATVRGSDDYLVVLSLGEDAGARRGGRLRAECDCPHGQEGFFCKHCVAVGLTLLRRAARVPAQRSRRAGTSSEPADGGATAGAADHGDAEMQGDAQAQADAGGETAQTNLGSWLSSLSREELIVLVCDQAIEDEDWRRRLELRAAAASADIAAVTDRAADLLLNDEEGDRLVGPYGYLEGEESWHYARRIWEVAAVVQDLAEAGHAAEAAAVAEEAFAAIAVTTRHASDAAGVITEAADELLAIHRQACRAAAADPAGLADFLAERLVRPDQVPEIDLADYADLLGEPGLARLRELVAAAWAANPAGWPERLAMEQVLEAAGDVDALVGVIASALDEHGVAHLRIVAILDEAGRPDEALAWAERGVREPARPDERLADFVVERYWAAGRADDAVGVRRERFEAAPSVAAYELLRRAAERAGRWEPVREWALGLLRADAARSRTAVGWPHWAPGPVLIDVLIADGDLDDAWESARGTATDEQWRRLADLVAESRPAEALAVYRRQIDKLRVETGDRAYERMAQLLASARDCHRRLGTVPAFDAYLHALRADQKRKPKLMSILNAHHL